jgi:methyl-accepting chemotaxis protein
MLNIRISMSFLNNFTIKRVVTISAIVIFSFITLNAFMTYQSADKTKTDFYDLKEEVLPHTFRFIELKIYIIQIQQWLTDISATRAAEGYDDGFAEAEKFYFKALDMTNFMIKVHQEYQEPDMVARLEKLKEDLKSYYKIGKDMANAYIKYGESEGNKLMEVLDPFSEKLQENIEWIVNDHKEEVESTTLTTFDELSHLQAMNLLHSIISILIIGVVFGYIFKVMGNISTITSLMEKYGKLDFREKVELEGKHEIAVISQNLNFTINNIKKFLLNTIEMNRVIIDESKGLIETIDTVSNGSKEQRKIIGDLNANLDRVRIFIEGQKLSSQDAMNNSFDTSRILSKMEEEMLDIAKSVNVNSDKQYQLAKELNGLNRSVQDVLNILENIKEISSQTNLLALNAAIEASRAGVHGRGFTVVSNEIQKLSESTDEIVDSIDQELQKFASKVEVIAQNMNSNAKEVDELTQIIDEINKHSAVANSKMVSTVSESERSFNSIKDLYEKTEMILENSRDVSTLSSENLKTIRTISRFTGNLSGKLGEQESELKKFKFGDEVSS